MKVKIPSLVILLLGCSPLVAQLALDTASDPAYDDGWSTGDNGGFGFLPWDLDGNNNDNSSFFAGGFIGDSTLEAGDIYTAVESFGLYGNPVGAFMNATRGFAPLSLGQTLSFQIAVNFGNGNKGFEFRSGANELLDFRVSDFNGTQVSSQEGLTANGLPRKSVGG